jgi:hypothetical protein
MNPLIEQAGRRICNDGVQSYEDPFNDLLIFAVGSALASDITAGGHGIIREKSVADVRAGFTNPTELMGQFKDLPGGGYEGEYQRLLNNTVGMGYLIVGGRGRRTVRDLYD